MSASLLARAEAAVERSLLSAPKAATPRASAMDRAAAPDPRGRGVVNGLAAYQLRYGKPSEALALLQVSQHLWPNDPQTLRLMVDAFIAVGDFSSAEMTHDLLLHAAPSRPLRRLDRLREAMIHFGLARLHDAKRIVEDVLRAARQGDRQ